MLRDVKKKGKKKILMKLPVYLKRERPKGDEAGDYNDEVKR